MEIIHRTTRRTFLQSLCHAETLRITYELRARYFIDRVEVVKPHTDNGRRVAPCRESTYAPTSFTHLLLGGPIQGIQKSKLARSDATAFSTVDICSNCYAKYPILSAELSALFPIKIK